MRFTTSIFFTICTVTSFLLGNSAAVPVQLQRKDVFDPRILFPAGGEHFHTGQTITVRWDTSELPANLTQTGFIVLAKPSGDSEHLDLNHTLASGFLLTDGHVPLTFPTDIHTAHNYAIVLFGDSGNISNNFTIKHVGYYGN